MKINLIIFAGTFRKNDETVPKIGRRRYENNTLNIRTNSFRLHLSKNIHAIFVQDINNFVPKLRNRIEHILGMPIYDVALVVTNIHHSFNLYYNQKELVQYFLPEISTLHRVTKFVIADEDSSIAHEHEIEKFCQGACQSFIWCKLTFVDSATLKLQWSKNKEYRTCTFIATSFDEEIQSLSAFLKKKENESKRKKSLQSLAPYFQGIVK